MKVAKMMIYRSIALTLMVLSVALAALTLLPGFRSGQNSNDLLMFGISPSERIPCPAALSAQPVQKLLLDLAIESRRPEYVWVALNDSSVTRAGLESPALEDDRCCRSLAKKSQLNCRGGRLNQGVEQVE